MPAIESAVRLRTVALLIIVSAAAAAGIGLVAWHLLPYEALERRGPVEQFLLWEAMMWMTGLALALFGVAAWFGATDLFGRHENLYMDRSSEHVRRQVQQGVGGRSLFADLPAAPWLMMGTGAGLMLLAAVVRLLIFG